ncbi:hypothetical protein JW897_04820 [Chromobacterium alkanivorans]|uniref:hypothetical protein n=1 Tax=Chromobacterium alkanivorans TaxID=1071719 RepID=UPI0019689359|nr:hypothetical protein [Chromobacterium alkanivorans]MBN3003054.1 hypothetical protein [Chromobacterium alkanivorans]
MKKRWLALCCVCWLTACASNGSKQLEGADEPAVKRMLQSGGSRREVLDAFGEPQDRIRFSGGRELWVYSYVQYRPQLQNFTDLAPLFSAQNRYDKELVLLFDAGGKVLQWRLSTREEVRGTGALNQSPAG